MRWGKKRCLEEDKWKQRNKRTTMWGKKDKKTITGATTLGDREIQPGSHQIVIWVAVVAGITEGLTESLPLSLSCCCCCGSQSALSHSLTLGPITQLYTVCLTGSADICYTYLLNGFWQNNNWLWDQQAGWGFCARPTMRKQGLR